VNKIIKVGRRAKASNLVKTAIPKVIQENVYLRLTIKRMDNNPSNEQNADSIPERSIDRHPSDNRNSATATYGNDVITLETFKNRCIKTLLMVKIKTRIPAYERIPIVCANPGIGNLNKDPPARIRV
jgi:hypothetical protein